MRNSKKIRNLIKESSIIENVTSDNSVKGIPDLLGLTRIVNSKIYRNMVCVQPTSMPIAAILGLKYTYDDNIAIHKTPNTHTGAIQDVNIYEEADPSKTYNETDRFIGEKKDSVYEATKDGIVIDEYDGDTTEDKIYNGILKGGIRIITDAADVSQFEKSDGTFIPYSSNVTIDKWQIEVKTRKSKIEPSLEVYDDMMSMGIDADEVIEDVLSTVIAQEVNKDIIQKLINVSNRLDIPYYAPDGVADFTKDVDREPSFIGKAINGLIGFAMSELITETTYSATYVLISKSVSNFLQAGGYLSAPEKPNAYGKLKNGLDVYLDTYNNFDYFLVGCKHEPEDIDMEYIGSLFYTPFIVDVSDMGDVDTTVSEDDEVSNSAGTFMITNSSKDFHNRVALMLRYGLSVNPYTFPKDQTKGYVKGDDWNKLIGKSQFSQLVGFKFPKSVKVTP